MCKRCRDHLQILTANASPVSQGNPTLMDISASETLAGDTLEEKSSESSEHKSTQVGSEKVHSFVSAFSAVVRGGAGGARAPPVFC